jgi:hypothetical protein
MGTLCIFIIPHYFGCPCRSNKHEYTRVTPSEDDYRRAEKKRHNFVVKALALVILQATVLSMDCGDYDNTYQFVFSLQILKRMLVLVSIMGVSAQKYFETNEY